MMNTTEIKKAIFPAVKDGETFKIAGMEFIKFPSVDGQTPVVMKNIAFNSRFGNNNDLRSSDVLRKMEAEILPKIIEAVGEENLCTVKTDLTTLDGLTPYGTMESFISLPTLDFYRTNVSIFDKYNPDCWWWLATPESAQPHDAPYWVVCVAPSGCIYGDYCNLDVGVRPFCIFKSSIFESSEN
jgi:hypothetical protein